MARIETRYHDVASLPPADMSTQVEHCSETPSTGGTAIAADGSIYLSDVNKKRILKIAPDGSVSTVIVDPG